MITRDTPGMGHGDLEEGVPGPGGGCTGAGEVCAGVGTGAGEMCAGVGTGAGEVKLVNTGAAHNHFASISPAAAVWGGRYEHHSDLYPTHVHHYDHVHQLWPSPGQQQQEVHTTASSMHRPTNAAVNGPNRSIVSPIFPIIHGSFPEEDVLVP